MALIEDLKPCPFCGSEAKLKITSSNAITYAQVLCTRCACGTFEGRQNDGIKFIERVVQAWNRRDHSVLCVECRAGEVKECELPKMQQ